MYRVEKVLNHNVILAIKEDNKQEYLIMGKGIGFGKKIAERIEVDDVQVQVYSLIDIKNEKIQRPLLRKLTLSTLRLQICF